MTQHVEPTTQPLQGVNTQRLLEAVFDSVRDGVAIVDATGRIQSCNAALCMLAQRTMSELLGNTPSQLWNGSVSALEALEEVTAGEETVKRPDGSARTVSVRAQMVSRDPATYLVLYRDITHLKVMERRGRESEDQYRFLLENVNDGVLITREASIVYANSHIANLLRYDPDALMLMERSTLGPLPQLDQAHHSSRFETQFRRSDGSELPVEVVASKGHFSQNAATFEIVRDISVRHRLERKTGVLLTLGQKLNHANTAEEVARVTMQAARELIGWDAFTFELAGEPGSRVLLPIVFVDTVDGELREVPPPEAEFQLNPMASQTLDHGPMLINREPDETAYGLKPFGDKSRRSRSLIFVPIRGGEDTVGVVSLQSYTWNAYTIEDMEALQALAEHCSGALQRSIALAKVRESEQRYRQMFENNRAVKLLLDPQGKIEDANPAACEFYGYSSEQLRKLTLHDLLVPMSGDVLELLRAAAEHQNKTICMKQRLANGEVRDVEISPGLGQDEGGELIHCIVHDVTARERALAQVAAIAELGRRLSSAVTSTEAGRVLVDVADRLIGWDACFVDLFATEMDASALKPGHLLIPVVHVDLVDGRRQEVPARYATLPAGAVSYRVLREGAYMVLRNPEQLERGYGEMFGDSNRPSASLLYVPIRGGNGILGVLSIQSYRVNAYKRADLDMLQSLADHCGGALERTRAEEQVRLLESAVRLSSDMVVITATDPNSPTGSRIVFVNEAMMKQTGYSREELVGKPLTMLQGPETDREELGRMRDALLAGKPTTVQLVNYRKDGSSYVVEFSAYSIADHHGRPRYFVSVQRDVTARKKTEQELVHRAFHDPLTGLPNRSLLYERLDHILARSGRSTERFDLLFVDLDSFKEVNDQHGHEVGDQLLMSVARRLELCVRPGDTVARLGGDEFVILLEGVENSQDATRVADRVLASFQQPHEVGELQLVCGASIGIAHQPSGPTTPADVLRMADTALYEAKAKGKQRYEVYTEASESPN